MAIRVEAFVPSPPYPSQTPERIMATESQAQELITTQIEEFVRFLDAPLRVFDYKVPKSLFYISSSENGFVGPDGFLMEKGRLQEIGIAIMKRYGLDKNVSSVVSYTSHSNGTFREHMVYPSQTVKDLEFDRWADFIDKTGQPTSARWEVGHHPFPIFRFGKLFKR